MLFNSYEFLLFLPAVVGLYYVTPHALRWVIIFLASCFFYMAYKPSYILILFAVILIDYTAGLFIERAASAGKRKVYLVLSLCANLAILVWFKYYNFFTDNLNGLFSVCGSTVTIPFIEVILPIGLSFHTFQSMSYTLDVYAGKQKAERHLGYFANYVLFFPQMVAGPIEKYKALGSQLRLNVSYEYANFANGFRLIVFGLFIKMVIADTVAMPVTSVFDDPKAYAPIHVIAAVLLFAVQIYADFYGYSTIAIGTARLFGIRLMDNFDTPYLASGINDFWRRWHKSLTGWFREYLYFPLGGNKRRMVFNILLVFAISGLWHGASWNFIIWGALHGCFCLLERGIIKLTKRSPDELPGYFKLLLSPLTFVLVSLIFVFFRTSTVNSAIQVFEGMFGQGNRMEKFPDYGYAIGFALVLFFTDILLYRKRFDVWVEEKPVYLRWGVYTLLLFLLMGMAGLKNLEFIYFKF